MPGPSSLKTSERAIAADPQRRRRGVLDRVAKQVAHDRQERLPIERSSSPAPIVDDDAQALRIGAIGHRVAAAWRRKSRRSTASSPATRPAL